MCLIPDDSFEVGVFLIHDLHRSVSSTLLVSSSMSLIRDASFDVGVFLIHDASFDVGVSLIHDASFYVHVSSTMPILKSMSFSSTIPVLLSMSHLRCSFLRRCLIHEASFLNCNVTRWRANIRCSQFRVEDGEREKTETKSRVCDEVARVC